MSEAQESERGLFSDNSCSAAAGESSAMVDVYEPPHAKPRLDSSEYDEEIFNTRCIFSDEKLLLTVKAMLFMN